MAVKRRSMHTMKVSCLSVTAEDLKDLGIGTVGHFTLAASVACNVHDPLRKSGRPKCCDVQYDFFNDVVECGSSALREAH